MVTDAVVIVADLVTGWETIGIEVGMMIMEKIAPRVIGGQVEVYRPLEKMTGAIDMILREIVIEVLVIVTETVDTAIVIEGIYSVILIKVIKHANDVKHENN